MGVLFSLVVAAVFLSTEAWLCFDFWDEIMLKVEEKKQK